MATIWLSPTNYVTGDSSLQISYPYVSHPGTIVTCATPGDLKWVSMSLGLKQGITIQSVIICYQVSNSRSSILDIRLSQVSTPDRALVLHDDGTNLKSTSPVCYTSVVNAIVLNSSGAVLLELRLNFQDTADQILLGAVGVVVSDADASCMKSVANIAALRNLVITTDPVYVRGCSASGDGGGGIFYWDTSGVYLLDDDIGIVIKSNVSSAGRWRRDGFVHFRSPRAQDVNPTVGPINVKWFGAKGDGSTDDTVAIQNAVSAAGEIAINLSQLPAPPIPVGLYSSSVVVLLPAGIYNVSNIVNGNTGIQVGGGSIRGEGCAVVQTLDPTLNIIRISAWGSVHNITFRGGLHQIAMFGYNTRTGALLSPTDFGNVPIVINGCNFAGCSGPAIWQDPGPVTTIDPASDGVVLPATTILVTSTFAFPDSGSFGVILSDGITVATINYTGKTSNTFTGCTLAAGTGGTLHTDDAVFLSGMWRTFQSTLRVSNFSFEGPHLYWGAGDSCMFSHGHIAWDFTTPLLTGDGLPMGLFNNAGRLWVNHVTAFGQGTQSPRQSMVVGIGEVKFTDTTWGQNDMLCFVRSRVRANTALAASGVPIPLPVDLSAPGRIAILLDTIGLVSAFEAYWLEVYESFPSALKVKNWDSDPDFDDTLGIWLDSSVDLNELLSRHTTDGSMEFDGFQDAFRFFHVFRGFEPGPSTLPINFLGTEVSDFVRLYRIEKDEPGNINSQVNLFNTATADAAAFAFGMTANSQTPDTSSGYPVTLCTATTGDPLVAQLTIGNSSSWIPPNLPAGIYCFSFYWKSNFSGVAIFTITPGPLVGVTNAVRKFEANDGWQRLWVPFFYPGNNSPYALEVTVYVPVVKIDAWAPSMPYAPGRQVTNGGNIYLSTGPGRSANGGAGPAGTGGGIIDGTCNWNFVRAGGAFVPACAMGLMMLNKGRHPGSYTFPKNNDAASSFGWVPRTYYGTAAPTVGNYMVGDILYNTAPMAGGNIGWVCTTAGSPGTWKVFGAISA